MKTIPLTQGRVAIVDDEDYAELSQFKWHYSANASGGDARRSAWTDGCDSNVLMHRQITGAADDQDVDHINHDTLDNRRENLRPCTTGQNCRNRSPNKRAHSKFKGVQRNGNHWWAGIRRDGVRHYLGTFATEEEAAAAYDAAARALDPEFAFMNGATR